MIGEGGVSATTSYIAKISRQDTTTYLVPPSAGLNKVYSPTLMKNGSLLAADAFGNRIIKVDCFGDGELVSCAANAAAYGVVQTLVDTYYPRAVYVAASSSGNEAVFFAGGDMNESTTYVKRYDFNTGSVSTIVAGST